MKKHLLSLLLIIIVFGGCKKDKNTQPDVMTNPVITNNAPGAATLLPTASPLTITSGITLTLPGTNLPNNPAQIKVLFNGVEGLVEFVSATMIAVKVPVTTNGNITVIIGNQTISGPGYTFVAAPSITSIEPTNITAGTVVTIKGTGLEASGFKTTVLFGGVAATIQSISPTEVKVVTPKTTTGRILLNITPAIMTYSPDYTYTAPELLGPYVSGDVALTSQSDVNTFVAMNKGKQLQITGGLSITGANINSLAGLSNITAISGQLLIQNADALTDAPFLNTLTAVGSIRILYSGLTSINFNNLNNFTGMVWFASLPKLTHVGFNRLSTPSSVTINYNPLLNDLDFLSNITETSSIAITNVKARSLEMDRLTSCRGIKLSGCMDLSVLSVKALSTMPGTAQNGIDIGQCPALKTVNFGSLTSIIGMLKLSDTGLADLNGFSALTNAGSLTIYGNSALTDLQGLKRLNAITLPAVTSGTLYGSSTFNGVSIDNNPKLASLDGLQNMTTLPMLRVTKNPVLNDICAVKKQILALNELPAYTYKYTPCCDLPIGTYKTGSVAALTMTTNGNYTTKQDAVDALASCK